MKTKNKMKKIVLLLVVLSASCEQRVEDLEIGEPFNSQEAILDQWDLVQVRHVDNLDINRRFTDVSTFFTTSAAEIAFTESAFTYTHGSGPNFLEESGSWAFDNPDFPGSLTLNGNTELLLKEPIRPFSDTITLVLERKCEERTISSYEYYFKRK